MLQPDRGAHFLLSFSFLSSYATRFHCSIMPATRWGIVSAGGISNDFAAAIRQYPSTENEIVCIAARQLKSAEEFAKKFNILKAYGSYKELAEDENVDVVYIGGVATAHAAVMEMMLKAKKNVLCEKPICLNSQQLRKVINLMKENDVFLMEAFWSRFFPVMSDFRQELNALGDIKVITVSFGADIQHIDRLRLKELGGGALLDLGCYALMFSNFIFGCEKPEKVVASGVDQLTTIALHYSKGRMVNITLSINCSLDNTLRVFGQNGSLVVPDFWHPTELIAPKKTYKYDLPKSSFKMNYDQSEGLAYEVKCVRECLLKGHRECPLMPLDNSVWVMEIMDEVRRQIGVHFDADH
ncbi:hypothetical protein CAPTEDRAFT_218954 [Capitella teleta]|uniref:Trans-1,2-dihydrobenzene-1,2-diol dehydrogenase n=1 Tax=Capitella teleta TaxID=283909 RepID=R7UB27_CAPTE|nr:hypothetical protein CAPTEDRAFT_218954 [Capitella teleta]|eukprot:ELU03565.1 hypothetical protein CAPTEDRAFT_218954 [Capitella teleta]